MSERTPREMVRDIEFWEALSSGHAWGKPLREWNRDALLHILLGLWRTPFPDYCAMRADAGDPLVDRWLHAQGNALCTLREFFGYEWDELSTITDPLVVTAREKIAEMRAMRGRCPNPHCNGRGRLWDAPNVGCSVCAGVVP